METIHEETVAFRSENPNCYDGLDSIQDRLRTYASHINGWIAYLRGNLAGYCPVATAMNEEEMMMAEGSFETQIKHYDFMSRTRPLAQLTPANIAARVRNQTSCLQARQVRRGERQANCSPSLAAANGIRHEDGASPIPQSHQSISSVQRAIMADSSPDRTGDRTTVTQSWVTRTTFNEDPEDQESTDPPELLSKVRTDYSEDPEE